ncbi:hypothetical protein ASE49_06480 [Novosphingobium sp. Leaf2]|nr:hypothetical protein ASE49_06480 [Novosphingobium sp. Leaf2]
MTPMVLCTTFSAVLAHADDPLASGMNADALARDRAAIRQLNQDQLASVQRRDAGYAQGWHDYADTRRQDDNAYPADQLSYRAAQNDYARQRKQYEQAIRDWRADVAACQSGDYGHCDR